MTTLRAFVGSTAVGQLPDPVGEPPAGTLLLDLGPDHPTRAGLVELHLWVDDDTIAAADVVAGHLHRGVEKLFEARDYRQVLSLADRHDWQAPFVGEVTIAMAIEELMGLEVPPRARWLRTLLAEHSRLHSHLGFLGWLAHVAQQPFGVREVREQLRQQLVTLTGNRIHPMVTRIGGVGADVDATWLAAECRVADRAVELADQLANLIPDLDLAGVAVVDVDTINGYGLSGPVVRAAGLAHDERMNTPGLMYQELSFTPLTDRGSDAAARFRVLAAEVAASGELIAAIAARLADVDGPIDVTLPRVVKVPEAETYLATEAPLGHTGVHLVSRGQPTPWRLRLRTPSAANISALPAILPGVPVARLTAALASIGWIVGDVDK